MFWNLFWGFLIAKAKTYIPLGIVCSSCCDKNACSKNFNRNKQQSSKELKYISSSAYVIGKPTESMAEGTKYEGHCTAKWMLKMFLACLHLWQKDHTS